MNKLLETLSGPNGLSTMRVAVLLIVIATLFKCVYLTITTGHNVSPDWEEVGLVLGSLSAKAVQRKFEKQPENPQ